MPTKLMTTSILLASIGLSTNAYADYSYDGTEAFAFHGYSRIGVGASNGKSQACFGLPGAQTKYRLGNECETYTELEANARLFQFDNGLTVSSVVMASLYNVNNRAPKFEPPNGNARLPQSYVQLTHIPGLEGARVWAGRIYYERNDTHINDFFYLAPSGLGAGVQDVSIGNGLKVSYALFRADSISQSNFASRHDFQLSGINTNPGGQLRLDFSYIQKPNIPTGGNGWSLTALHTQNDVFGGKNKLALQYGVGPGTALGQTGDLTSDSSTKRWRIMDAMDWQFTPQFGGQVTMINQRDSSPTGSQNWWSFGVRPVYAFSEHFKLVTEYGHDRVSPSGSGQTRTLNKITIAPTLAMAPSFWSRPELRLFYTYAQWNKAAQAAADSASPGSALSSTGAFGSSRSGSTIGIQLETWW